MKNRFSQKKLAVVSWRSLASAGVCLAATAGCAKQEGASAPSVGLSGSFSTASTTTALSRAGKNAIRNRTATSYTGDKVVCATLASPPVTATSDVSSDGKFTVSILGGLNQPMTCSLVDSSGNLLASIVSSDTQNKDLSGHETTQDTLAFSASAELGDISYDSTTGEATVPVSQISSALASSTLGTTFDPTGNWVIGSVNFTLPAGYQNPCANDHDNCNGPPEGQVIAMTRFQGVSTKDSSAPVYALQIWNSSAAQDSCAVSGKHVLGYTDTQLRALNLDFSSLGSTVEHAFGFASAITVDNSSHAISDGYKIAGAASQYDFQLGCGSASITVAGVAHDGWLCKDENGYYQAMLGGGCVNTSTGAAVQMNGNWPTASCTTTSLGGGYQKQSCVGDATVNSQTVNVTCSNEFGSFSDAALTVPLTTGQQFDWTNVNANRIVQGTDCSSSLFDGHALLQEQCYAMYYQQKVGDHTDACVPRVNQDWTTTDPASFVTVGDRPSALVLIDQLRYDPSGQSGFLRTAQDNVQGVPSSSGQGWTNCKVHEVDSLSFRRVDDTHMVATYVSSTTTSSTDKPDCVIAYGSGQSKFMFQLTHQ